MRTRGLSAALLGVAVVVVMGGLWVYISEKKATLYESILTSDWAALESYLEAGGDPNASTEVRDTGVYIPLLKIAMYDRKEEVALLLLDQGADFETGDMTAYDIAREGMSRLLDHAFTQGLVDSDIETLGYALSSAANSGYYDVVEVIFRHVDRASQEAGWDVKLNLAAHGSMGAADDVARLLLDTATDLSQSLHAAARFSSPGMIRYLLARVDGQTPVAAWKQHPGPRADRILHELILGGADVCWLVEHVDELPGFSNIFLRDSAPHCRE